jgi:DNA polymerase-3 subunit epsilon
MDANTAEATIWAKNLLKRNDWVILDTETTGLDANAEICQIAICNHRGEAVMNTLVKPGVGMTMGAYMVHRISDDDFKNSPMFPGIHYQLQEAMRGKTVIIYNAKFDRRIIRHCCTTYNLPIIRCKGIECLMEEYSRWYPHYRKRGGGYKWKKLPGGDHSAIGDCLAALQVIRKMAGVENKIALSC